MATTITTSQTASTLPQKKGDPPNFGTVKSGRALSFDGAVDSLVSESTHSFLDVSQDFTYAVWIKATSLSDACIINYGNDGSNRSGIVLSSGGKIGFSTYNGSGYTHIATPSENYISINQWHRVVATCSNNTLKFYLNGVEQTNTTLIFTSAFASMSYNRFTIGSRSNTNSPSKFFAGYISDVQVWSAVWTLTDVQNDYRHPEMLAHTLSGTSLTESNLKLWYPMTEGNPENPQTTIFDGSPKGLGSELVTNGGFDTDTAWTKAGEWSIDTVNGVAKGNGTDGNLTQTNILVSGKYYKATYTIKDYVSGSVRIELSDDNAEGITRSSNGTFTEIFKANNDFVRFDARTAFTGSIDDVSVKEIQRGNHATSVFYGDELFTTSDASSITNEANGTGAWTDTNASNTTQSVESTTVHDGSYAVKCTVTGNGGGVYIDMNNYCTVGKTYKLSIYGRHAGDGTANNKHIIRFSSATGLGLNTTDLGSSFDKEDDSSAWAERTKTFVYDGNIYRYFGVKETGSENDGSMLLDSLSIKEVGLSTTGHVEGQETIFQPAFVGQNRMIAFDGVDDYVDLGSNSSPSFPTGGWSVSAWFNSMHTHSSDSYNTIFSKISGAAAGFFARIATSNGATIVQVSKDGTDKIYESSGILTAVEGQWYNIVLTYSGTSDEKVNVYINGSNVLSDEGLYAGASSPAYVEPSEQFKIGGNYGGTSENFAGFITEVSSWTSVLSLTQIQEIYNDGVPLDLENNTLTGSPTLTGYWRNNELHTDGAWKDLTESDGSGDNGTVAGAPVTTIFPEGTTSGRDINGFFLTHPNKNYLSLDGTDNCHIEVPHSDVFDFGTGSFTVQFWIKPHTLTNNDRIITKGTTDAGEWMISVNTDGSSNKVVRVYTKDSDSNVVDTGSETTKTLTINTWAFITVVFDRPNEDILVYKDDSLTEYNKDASTWDATKTFDNTEPITIGASDTLATGTFFDGIIDDVRIYNKVLSEPDITKNYRHGKAKHKD